MRRLFFMALFVAACTKKEAPRAAEIDASPPPVVLEPMETPDPSPPLSSSARLVDAAAPEFPQAPSGHFYLDKDDLPMSTGLARCPGGVPNGHVAVVRLEVIMSPQKTIDLVIPSLNIRRRLWKPHPNEPSSCYSASTENDSDPGLRFFCSTDEGSVGGKVYQRWSDIVLGTNATSAKNQERFELPCGVQPRFEKVICPAACEKDRGVHFPKSECACPQSAGLAPMPASTNHRP